MDKDIKKRTRRFTEVLTLCSVCGKEIVVKATYEERNHKFTCTECSGTIVDCEECGGGGFSGLGTGYDAVCGNCGGLGKHPKF